MKKLTIAISVLAFIIASAGSSSAIPFLEVFDQDIKLFEGDRAIYNFDLTGVGGQVFHRASSGTITSFGTPTVDEAALDLSLYEVDSAQLSFNIGGLDQGQFVPDERIKIRVTGESIGGDTLFNDIVSIGVDTFDFDIAADWLMDGMLRTVAIAVSRPDAIPYGQNDFKIRSAQLSVDATARIVQPEPATIILVGSGIVGFAAYRRRGKFKKKLS